MIKFWSIIAGYKTYIIALVYGIDATGSQMGWWDVGSVRNVIEQVFVVFALRSGISASGPVALKP